MDFVGSRPAIMGVLNITPDSFSDGGDFLDLDLALQRARQMVDEGAAIIDVGGESSRPGAQVVSEEQELERVLPVVSGLVQLGIAVSVDTRKSKVASECLSAGAECINDITGFSDPEMVKVIAKSSATACIMHMQGEPGSMQNNPHYSDVCAEVFGFLGSRAHALIDQGITSDRIWVDPGIGFGKTLDHNLKLLKNIGNLVQMGFPVLIGVSRKSYLGKIFDEPDPLKRLSGSLASQVLAQASGVKIIRTHDVLQTSRAIETVARILES